MRFLGPPAFWGCSPLVRSDGADRTINAMAAAIASMRPRPSVLSFEFLDDDSRWPGAIVERWPGRGAWLRRRVSTQAVAVKLEGTFDEWVQTRRSDWRGGYRRRQRRLAEIGGVVRRPRCAREVGRCLDELIRLHHSRWKQGSEWLTPEVQRTLQEAAERLVADDGFRLWTVEIGGRVIGATVFATAGGAVTALLTAFDPEWGRFAPGLSSMVAGIEEGFHLGEKWVDLGYGDFRYKHQLANDVRQISSYEVFARDFRYPMVRAHALPRHAHERFNQGRVRLCARSRLVNARKRVLARIDQAARL